MRYLSRYVFKTATGNRPVPLRPDGQVRWPYRESQTGRNTALDLAPLDWMSRLLQHILPRGFARVRTFGWLHPAAKVRGNRVRALLRQAPLLSEAEQKAWPPPMEAEPNPPEAPEIKVCSAPWCPRCRRAMRLVGSFRPGQPWLYLKRPP